MDMGCLPEACSVTRKKCTWFILYLLKKNDLALDSLSFFMQGSWRNMGLSRWPEIPALIFSMIVSESPSVSLDQSHFSCVSQVLPICSPYHCCTLSTMADANLTYFLQISFPSSCCCLPRSASGDIITVSFPFCLHLCWTRFVFVSDLFPLPLPLLSSPFSGLVCHIKLKSSQAGIKTTMSLTGFFVCLFFISSLVSLRFVLECDSLFTSIIMLETRVTKVFILWSSVRARWGDACQAVSRVCVMYACYCLYSH